MHYVLKALTALLLVNVAVGGCLLFALRSPATPAPELHLAGEVDDSGYRLQLAGKYTPAEIVELKSVISSHLDALDNRYSLQRPESESARLFLAPENIPFAVSNGFSILILRLMWIEKLTHGAFKPFCTTQSISWWTWHDYQQQGDQCAEYQVGSNALLYLGHSVIPAMPIALRLQRLLDGMRIDDLADELEHRGIASYRIEVGGMLKAGKDIWPIAMDSVHNAQLRNGALLHGNTPDGNGFWVEAQSAASGAAMLEALSVLTMHEGVLLARQAHWKVRWASGSR